MYDLDRLLADVARTRGPLTKRGGGDYQQVWDAFNRYLSEVIDKRQTLSVANFCKIGWRIEEQTQGKAKMRPHFQVADAFARSYNLDAKAHPQAPDRALAQAEEFNFSKAAIRYTQTLTKDNIFMGMRAIVHAIGEAAAAGQAVAVDFEVGRLTFTERAVRFDFVAELYVREGLEVPSGAPQDANYRPSATFAAPSREAASALNLTGKADGFSAPIKPHSAFLGGGWAEPGAAATMAAGTATAAGGWAVAERADQMSEGGETQFTAYPASSSSNLSGRERVHNEALERHLYKIEADADQAIAEKESWEQHLRRSQDEERKDAEYRRAVAKDHQESLKDQIQEAERRRAHGRQHVVEMASMHDFPSFAECPEQPVYDYIRERNKHLKEDLDDQVELKRRMKVTARQRELEQEATHADASRKELAIMHLEGLVRQEQHKATLHESWERDKHMRAAKRAIEDHHRTPAAKSNLSGITGVGSQSGGGFAATPRSPAFSATLSATLGPGASPARSPRADFGAVGGPPSRPMTGSVRRVPFGAAASLALHKDKLGATLKR